MNPSVMISKFYHYLIAEINWLLIFFINSYTQPAVFITFSLLKGTTLEWQNYEELSLMIYHLPEQISLKTRSSCMHYRITFNLLLQFTQFIHYPLLPLVFYHIIVLYIRGCFYMSILTASL